MDRRTRCEQSFYKPLYHFEMTGQTLLIDETTDELLLRKRLRRYNEAVYAHLKRHPHPNLARIKSYWREDDGRLTVIETYVLPAKVSQSCESMPKHLGKLSRGCERIF